MKNKEEHIIEIKDVKIKDIIDVSNNIINQDDFYDKKKILYMN
tara:strand:- start:21 stop:149 length:129 start_codon:yes stop_codon:yes gene_type:complete